MVDVSVTASEVLKDATTVIKSGIAGATITAGQVVYLSNAQYLLADSDAGLTEATAVGIALNGASSGQPLDIATGGNVTIGASASLVDGGVYVLSGTAGGIAPVADLTTGDYTCVLGVANSDQLRLCIKQGGVIRA